MSEPDKLYNKTFTDIFNPLKWLIKSQPGKGMFNGEMKMKIYSHIAEDFRQNEENKPFKFKRIKIECP